MSRALSRIAALHYYAGEMMALPWEGDIASHEGREVVVIEATYFGDLVVRDPAKPAALEIVQPGACHLVRRGNGR